MYKLGERLLAKEKSKMSILGACIRKLTHLCFGVPGIGRPHKPTFAM
jgi:transposase